MAHQELEMVLMGSRRKNSHGCCRHVVLPLPLHYQPSRRTSSDATGRETKVGILNTDSQDIILKLSGFILYLAFNANC